MVAIAVSVEHSPNCKKIVQNGIGDLRHTKRIFYKGFLSLIKNLYSKKIKRGNNDGKSKIRNITEGMDSRSNHF